jgi:endonuclease/exonuclease/phosphatase family metal-dependent hydrolase
MTYNIRGTKGMDNRRSARRIAEVIRDSGSQIICLQEVCERLPWARMVDQPAVLARELRMDVAFQRNLSIGVGGFGNAVLSTFEIAGSCSHSLTSKGEQRGALEVRLTTPDGPLTVFCTHLGLDRDERLTQARELASAVNSTPSPKLVCGDFNEEAGAAGVTELIRLAGLIDADPDGPPTFDSVQPRSRIDMILCAPSIAMQRVSVVQSTASDHLPLLADLAVDAESSSA